MGGPTLPSGGRRTTVITPVVTSNGIAPIAAEDISGRYVHAMCITDGIGEPVRALQLPGYTSVAVGTTVVAVALNGVATFGYLGFKPASGGRIQSDDIDATWEAITDDEVPWAGVIRGPDGWLKFASGGGSTSRIRRITTAISRTLTAADWTGYDTLIVEVSSTASARTITAPTLASLGRPAHLLLVCLDATNPVHLDMTGGGTINGNSLPVPVINSQVGFRPIYLPPAGTALWTNANN